MKEKIVRSGGNVFTDLGFTPEEVAVLTMRAELMAALRHLIAERGWTQTEAAHHFGIAQSRVSDLVRGKWGKFNVDMLVTLAAEWVGNPPWCLKQAEPNAITPAPCPTGRRKQVTRLAGVAGRAASTSPPSSAPAPRRCAPR